MDSPDQPPSQRELPPEARRAVHIILVAMAAFMLLPFLLLWVTGAIRF